MRISLDWLREYVDIDVPLEALVERLHGIGLPVEQVERAGSDTVLEIELTTNRPDCMSVLGIARRWPSFSAGRFEPPLRVRSSHRPPLRRGWRSRSPIATGAPGSRPR